MSTGVYLFLLVGYMILGLYIYHSMFNVMYFNLGKGLIREIFVAMFFGMIMTGLTLYFYVLSMIIIIILGIIIAFKYDNSKKRVAVIIVFTVIGIIIAITGYNLKQSIELTEEEQYYQDENYEIDSYREDSYLEEEVESDSGKEGIFSEGISESNVSDMQNIRVFLNVSGETVLCMAEYDTPSSDGAIGEMMISNIDGEVVVETKYYLETPGEAYWWEESEYEEIYYIHDGEFTYHLGLSSTDYGTKELVYNWSDRCIDMYEEWTDWEEELLQ